MKYLCLAYGDAKDWNALSPELQKQLLAQDEVIRSRGNLVAAVHGSATSLRAWEGIPEVSSARVAVSPVPLAGFAVIEAEDIDAVVRLIADTPCPRAKGYVEIHPILAISEYHTSEEHGAT